MTKFVALMLLVFCTATANAQLNGIGFGIKREREQAQLQAQLQEANRPRQHSMMGKAIIDALTSPKVQWSYELRRSAHPVPDDIVTLKSGNIVVVNSENHAPSVTVNGKSVDEFFTKDDLRAIMQIADQFRISEKQRREKEIVDSIKPNIK